MAHVTAPLGSFQATGTIGKLLTFETRNRRNIVYSKKTKTGYIIAGKLAGFGNNKYGAFFYGYHGRASRTGSQAQGARRVIFLAGWAAYALLTDEQKAVLSREAETKHMTGANLFISRYMRENHL